jgi:demethylmenaquinone methyltransferase/2-methoxy-6-polyprenyl-1,4-benzoquinol methylase
MRVPCADASFDAAMVAFGIRNVIDPAAACAEFARVLHPGGRLAILEFGSPSTPGLRELYNWYFRVVLPRVGRLISRHGDAYAYLPASVAEFPTPERFSRILQQSGFGHIRCEALTMGVVYLYLAERV